MNLPPTDTLLYANCAIGQDRVLLMAKQRFYDKPDVVSHFANRLTLRPAHRERLAACRGGRSGAGSAGVVFGDIGTSPLYTLHECLLNVGGKRVSAESARRRT